MYREPSNRTSSVTSPVRSRNVPTGIDARLATAEIGAEVIDTSSGRVPRNDPPSQAVTLIAAVPSRSAR